MDVDGDGVFLRRAGGTAAVGDVFFEEFGKAVNDGRFFGLKVMLLADIGGEVEELERWEAG